MKQALILILALAVLAQANQEQQYEQGEPQLEARLRQEGSMKQTACLVLSRYHTNSHKQTVEEVISSLAPSDQQAYINKLYTVAVEKCFPSISIQQAQQFFIEQNSNFDPTSMFYLLDGIDYPSIANNMELTPNQKNILKFIKKFDQEMQVRKEQREAQQGSQEDDINSMGLFGLPFGHFNSLAGYAYIIVLLVIVIGGFVWGFMQLNNSSLPKNNKKKNKKHKQQKSQ